MIRINLLRKTVKRRPTSKGIPAKVWIIGGSSLGGVVLIVAGIIIWNILQESKVVPMRIAEDDFSPSTYARAHAIEEVVRELDDSGEKLRRGGMLDLPYAELSFEEKVNYEINFAKNLVVFLGRTVPRGIGLRTIKIANFTRVQGTAVTQSRESITSMLRGIRQEDQKLLPQPHTRIARQKDEYHFTFACNLEFGLNLAAEFVDLGLAFLPPKGKVGNAVVKTAAIAREKGIVLEGDLRRLSADVDGQYRRYRYSLSGSSSYSEFVAFVNGLYEARVPVAFESVRLVAVTKSKLRIDADLLYTTTN